MAMRIISLHYNIILYIMYNTHNKTQRPTKAYNTT